MLAQLDSATVVGIEAYPIQVQVYVSGGMGKFDIVGLPDTAVKESAKRVEAAVKNSNFEFSHSHHITVNLAPADLRKVGPAFDLPIALGTLAASEQITGKYLDSFLVVGELALDGTVRPVNGALSLAMTAREQGKRLMCPRGNLPEASVVEGLEIYPVTTLYEAATIVCDPGLPERAAPDLDLLARPQFEVDFAEVRGQEVAKRALEVAAAGGHNVLMIGPPGSGKTMLARRLPTILPPLTPAEALECTRVYSVAGMLPAGEGLISQRPFRAPHHTVSSPGMVGGGAFPRPGEISLAHHGVLFLDEFPEFSRDCLESLRQPLEDGVVTISRAQASLSYPARLMLVAAMNPCPCGFYGDAVKNCTCSPSAVHNYVRRVSGPLLDRIDVHLEVARPKTDEVLGRAGTGGETSAVIRERVTAAREIQHQRFRPATDRPAGGAATAIFCNAQMRTRHLRQYCALTPGCEALLRHALENLGLSVRAHDRILRLARTIADLAASPNIAEEHMAEAINYRSLDRKAWG